MLTFPLQIFSCSCNASPTAVVHSQVEQNSDVPNVDNTITDEKIAAEEDEKRFPQLEENKFNEKTVSDDDSGSVIFPQ